MYLTDIDTAHINTSLTTGITIPFDVNFHIKFRILCSNPSRGQMSKALLEAELERSEESAEAEDLMKPRWGKQ